MMESLLSALAAAIPVVVQGNDLFGVEGLSFSGLGTWGLLAAIVIWWVRGMPERRRAANEHVTVSATAMAALVKHLTAEVERLGALVTIQSSRITELEHKLSHTEGEVIRLKAASAGLGDAAQHAALIVAQAAQDAKEAKKP